jgi:hypothetical protein
MHQAIKPLLKEEDLVTMGQLKRVLFDTNLDEKDLTQFVLAIDELFGDETGNIPSKLITETLVTEAGMAPKTKKVFKQKEKEKPEAVVSVYDIFRTLAGQKNKLDDEYLSKFDKNKNYLIDVDELQLIFKALFQF